MSEEIKKILGAERLSFQIYSELLRIETNKKLKAKLADLREIDRRHIKIWEEIYTDLKIPIKEKNYYFTAAGFVFLRRLFGKGLVLSIINSMENKKVSTLSKVFISIPQSQRKKVTSYLVEELYQERILKKENWESGLLSHIRDVVFGMNDGLVEVLAAVSGFTGIINNNILIAAAGTIVGLSGTISMAVGAYLSSKSEGDIDRDGLSRLELELQIAKERLSEDIAKHKESYHAFSNSVDELISKLKSERDPIYKVLEREKGNPLIKFLGPKGRISKDGAGVGISPGKDAAYVGAFYILGAIIPLLSFFVGSFIGSQPYINLIVAIILTSIAITITSMIIALNSNESAGRYVARALSLSLAATAITFLVGRFAAVYLHLLV
jgi:VIT1/CCC1 family predicted Fe2+/Mn2+ transporter